MPGVLAWGYYPTNEIWLPVQVDSSGRLKVDMSAINLDDLADVEVPTPTDGYVLYWDAATSLWKCKAISGMEIHGNEYHNPDFEQEGVAAGLVDAHKDLTTGVHGVGAGTIAEVADIAVDANLSAAAQDAISKRHTQNTDKVIKDADGDTQVQVEESADEDKVHMDVKGVEAFLLDDVGVLTLAKQSGFRAYRTATQSVNPMTWTKVQYNTEEYDIQGEYDHVTNSRFTATKAGRYLVTAVCGLDSLADGKAVTLVVVRNGNLFMVGARRLISLTTGAAAGLCFSGSGIMNLAANDYIEIYVLHTDAVARSTPAEAFSMSFEVSKVA